MKFSEPWYRLSWVIEQDDGTRVEDAGFYPESHLNGTMIPWFRALTKHGARVGWTAQPAN